METIKYPIRKEGSNAEWVKERGSTKPCLMAFAKSPELIRIGLVG